MPNRRKPNDTENPVRSIISAGMPAAIWDDFARRFDVSLYEFYGAAEGGLTGNPPGVGPVGSIGKPVRHSVLPLVDEAGQDVPKDAHGERVGELLFRHKDGTPFRVEYHGNPEASARKCAGGWLHMGDEVREDRDGWLYFQCRKGSGIRRNGDFINSAFIEKVIAEQPQIDDVYVYGIPSANGVPGEKDVVAAVVPASRALFRCAGAIPHLPGQTGSQLRAEPYPVAAADPQDCFGKATGSFPGRSPRIQSSRRVHRSALTRLPQSFHGASTCHSDARSSSTALTAIPASSWPSRWRIARFRSISPAAAEDKLDKALGIVRERLGASAQLEAGRRDRRCRQRGRQAAAGVPAVQRGDQRRGSIRPQVAWPGGGGRAQGWLPLHGHDGRTGLTVIAIADRYGAEFAAKDLLLAPATSFMWSSGALAAEVVLEDPEIDSLDILYQVDNGLPSEASTKSFLRMVCNDTSQYYLEQNEYKAWPNDVAHDVFVPYRNVKMRAHPWGGACRSRSRLKGRVRNCKVLTAIGEHMIDGILQAIRAFNAQSPGLDQAGREALTNAISTQISTGEPPRGPP